MEGPAAGTPLTAAQKKAGNKMALELNAIFPDIDLRVVADCIRQSNFNFDGALELLLAYQAKSNNQASKQSAIPEPKSEPSKEYREALSQIRGLIDCADTPDSVILDYLRAAKGDLERVILQLVESQSSSVETAPAAPVVSSSKEKGKQKLEDSDTSDTEIEDAGFDEDAMDVGLEMSDSDVEMDSAGLVDTSDSDNCLESSAEIADTLGSDDELDWFEPVDTARVRSNRPALDSEVDEFTRFYQEEADREFALSIQQELQQPRRESDYGAASPFARLARADTGGGSWSFSEFQRQSTIEKHREEYRKNLSKPHTTSTVVENPELKKWLLEQDERNTMKLMHANDGPAKKESSARPSAGPRLHTVLQELKKIEQELKVFSANTALIAERSEASTAQPKTRRGKHVSRQLEEMEKEKLIRAALKRSQEREGNEKAMMDSGEFIPRASLNESLDSSLGKTYSIEDIQHLPAPIPLKDCLTIQDEEILQLRSSYGKTAVLVSESIPRRISVPIREPTFFRRKTSKTGASETQVFGFVNPLRLVLIATLPALYPNPSTPIIELAIRSGSLKMQDQLDETILAELEQFLIQKSLRRIAAHKPIATQFADPLTISELADAAETWLESSPKVAECARRSRQSALSKDAESSGVDYGESLRHILAADFTVMSTDDILAQREDTIAKAFETMSSFTPSISMAAVRVLLRFFKWETDVLVARWLSSRDDPRSLDAVLAEAGLLPHQAFLAGKEIDQREQILLRGAWECPVCCEDFSSASEAVTLPCGHFFCKDCMKQHLKIQIMDGSASTVASGREAITCPGNKCKFLIDTVTLASLADPILYSHYIRFVTNAYVEKHPNIAWCPSGRGCEYAVAVTGSSRMVECKCGYVFCFSCKQEGHWPAACEEMKWYRDTHPEARLMDPAEEENKSMQWILSHTQDCPRCRANIQKNGGCNHMSCTSCNHHFCWMCLSDWAPSHYACKTYVKRSSSSTEQDESYLKAEMNLGFRSLWHIHAHQKDSDAKLKSRLLQEISSLIKVQRISSNVAVCESILKALEYLYLCRHIVLITCVVGMFLVKHQVGGSHILKPEIRRLGSDISFLHSILSRPLRKLQTQEIISCVGSIKSSVKNMMHVVGRLRLHLQERAARLGPIEIETPPKAGK